MDSSNCSANYKLTAIKAAIADGSLTKEEIYKRLTYAIHKENEKRPEERDTDFMMACETILYEMHTGHPYVSRREESKRALKIRLNHEIPQKAASSRIIKRVLLATGALVILVLGLEILLHHQWLEGVQSPDEQQYIIAGQEVDPGLVDEGLADNAGQSQTITTVDLDEVVNMLGYTPLIPTWLPDGWSVESYYARISTATTFRVQYQNEQEEDLLRFGITVYPDIDMASLEFEQAKAGAETPCNGWMVYVAENVNRCIAVWQADTICYSLTGPVTLDEVLQMINSIQRSD